MVVTEHQKRTLHYLADGAFHSGTQLAKLLGISRSAVCKQIHALSSLGIEVIAISGKGYKIKRPLQLLEVDQICRYLSPDVSRYLSNIQIFDHIHSTNQYLWQLAQASASSGTVCLAESQSAGKGRRGRSWVSPFGANVYLSLLWRYQGCPAELSGLSLAAGVAVIRALRSQGIDGVGLKWPNDIYWQGKKLGGILIEVSGESEGPCQVIVGLGLNAYLPPSFSASIDQPWVDLDTIAGQTTHYLRNRLAAELINQLLPVIAKFDHFGLQNYIGEWRQYDCLLHQHAAVYSGQQRLHGQILGVDQQGLLLLKDRQGGIRSFASGEISFHAQNA